MQAKRSESGQTTMLMALFLGTFLFGFVALGVDLAYMFRAKRMAQAAADGAALAAAEESSYSSSAETAAAKAVAKLNGFDTTATTNPATVTPNSPPTLGNYKTSSYIEVIVTKPIPTFFMGVMHAHGTVTVAARAVAAGGQTSPTCVCLEGSTGTDLSLSNNSHLTASSCGVTVNSSSSNAVGIVGSAVLTAESIGSVSTNWDTSANVNNNGTIASSTKVVQGITTTCSPTMPVAPTYSSSQCTGDPLTHYSSGASTYSVGPGSTYSTTQSGNVVCYTSLTVGTNSDRVTLNAGTYVISGGSLHFESGSGGYSNYGGSGVYFYLTNGASLTIDSGANVNLTAMTSGTYSGILIQQDSADTNALSIQGGASTSFNGAVYAPGAAITLGNGSGSTINADIVAKSLTMNGGGTLTSTPISNLGTLNISVAKLVE